VLSHPTHRALMSASRQVAVEPRIVVVADPAMVARLRPLVPGVRLEETTLEELEAEAARLRPRVVFCAARDAAAGLIVLKRLRSGGASPRILFLTPADAVEERLAALDTGFDDVLSAPVGDAELAGRLALLLRRLPATRVTRLPVGDGLELDIDRRELLRDGEWVHLRPKEAGLLELLARTPGRPSWRPLASSFEVSTPMR